MKKRAVMAALILGLLAISGCNTVEGFGRDISGGANVVRGWFM